MDWNKYCDHIYCFHHTKDRNRYEAIRSELDRVGILNSGIFSFVFTSPDPYEQAVLDSIPQEKRQWENDADNRRFINLALASARVYREALYLGYKRVLFLEDDARFLKDINRIAEIFDAAPKADAVQFDKYLLWGYEDNAFDEMMRKNRINDLFFNPKDKVIPSGACAILSDKAMVSLLAMAETNTPRPFDGVLQCFPNLTRAVAIENAAVQIVYNGSMTQSYSHGETHYKAYQLQGLDLTKYNIPAGYESKGTTE